MKILFITLSNVGDVILALPALKALKDNFPDAKVDVVLGPRPKEIFAKDPRVNRIFTYDKHGTLRDKIAFVGELRKERYDMAVDMRGSLFPVLIGAKRRTLLFHGNKTAHKRSRHLGRLDSMGIRYEGGRSIHVDDEDRGFTERLLKTNGIEGEDVIIGVSPSCRSLLKQWDTQGFIEVINALLEKESYKIVLIGDSGQIGVSKKIRDAVRHKGMVDLTGRTNLNQLFALVGRMNLLLTCDSAALHIACDLGIKVVAIFGPTDPAEYGPTGKADVVIQRKLGCVPCRKPRCRFKHECMKQITAREVTEAVRSVICSKEIL